MRAWIDHAIEGIDDLYGQTRDFGLADDESALLRASASELIDELLDRWCSIDATLGMAEEGETPRPGPSA